MFGVRARARKVMAVDLSGVTNSSAEEWEKGMGKVEKTDDQADFVESKPNDIWGVPMSIVVFVIAALFSMIWSWCYQFISSIPLYQGSNSTMQFQKKALQVGIPTNYSTHTREYLDAENNGDIFYIAPLFAGLAWGTFAIYFCAFAWAVLVFQCSGIYRANAHTLWGINHFALFFARGLFYMICWPIMFFMFSYDTYMAWVAGFFMTLVVQLVSMIMSIFMQVASDPNLPRPNPVFTLFALFVVAVCISSTIAYPVTMFIANERAQVLVYRGVTTINGLPYYNVKAMFAALMFDVCLNHISNLHKWLKIFLEIFNTDLEEKEESFVEYFKVSRVLNQFVLDTFEHLSVICCGIVFVVHYHASFTWVQWPAI